MVQYIRENWQSLTVITVATVLFTLAYCRGSTGCFLSADRPQREPRNEVVAPTQSKSVGLREEGLVKEIPSAGNVSGEKEMSTAYTPGKVEHANESNFEQQVINADVPVLVDFYADWCGPCKMIAPVLEEVAREVDGARVVKVNVDNSPRLAARYGISSIPSLLVFKNGKVVSQHIGLASKAQLKAMLES